MADASRKKPEMVRIALSAIREPRLAARESMDPAKLAELIESMRDVGLLQPILVTPSDPPSAHVYEIVCGHRRYLAARELGWTQIAAIVYTGKDIAAAAAKAHENTMREDMTAAEEATYYAALLEQHGLDEAGLVALVKRSREHVASRLALLRGDERVLQALRERRIGFAVARELNRITDEPLRRYYLDSAARSGCSSRVVAEWVATWRAHIQAPVLQSPPQEGDGAPAPSAEIPSPPPLACELCGGSRDPYNLVMIHVHKWELEELRAALRQKAEQ